MGAVPEYMWGVVKAVSAHEGGYDALNLNRDKAGLSFGFLQWSQRTGALGELLMAMHRLEPALCAKVFGPDLPTLLQVTRAGLLDPVAGHLLWESPWMERFQAAGRTPALKAVQDRVAIEGPHMAGALVAARTLGVPTPRCLALTFDTAVQQGPGTARRLALAARAEFPPDLSDAERLKCFAQRCPEAFRSKTCPAPRTGSHLAWKPVGAEWHAFAGVIDLALDVARRRQELLSDPSLSDVRVELPEPR